MSALKMLNEDLLRSLMEQCGGKEVQNEEETTELIKLIRKHKMLNDKDLFVLGAEMMLGNDLGIQVWFIHGILVGLELQKRFIESKELESLHKL